MILDHQKMTNNIHFEKWTADQVAEWLRGLDMEDAMIPYMHYFLNSGVDGKKLMLMTHADLEKLNVIKFGHQELILEAIDLLRNLRYGYETENLQSLALQLGCKARSLKGEVRARSGENDRNRANVSHHGGEQSPQRRLTISILSSVADLVTTLKSLVAWMDKAPFSGFHDLCLVRNTIVKIGLDLINMCQKESTFPDLDMCITNTTTLLSEVCEKLVIGSSETPLDPLYLQPASLEQATIRKKQGEELGMHIQSSYYGVHVISGIKDMSPADLCGKIEKGDEVIQVNGQVVAGWSLKKLVNLLKENPKEVVLFLKKRPRHIVPYGQMPNRKKHEVQASTLPKSRKKLRSREDNSNKNQLRPALPEFVSSVPLETEDLDSPKETNDGNDTDNDVFRSGSESPQFTQYTLPVQPDPKQRRATVSGGSPTLCRPLLVIEDIDTPSRPKSFTIATTTGNMPHEIIINSPSGDNLADLSKLASAVEKRKGYQTKSTPPSLEYSVCKPTPVIIEPKDSPEQKDKKAESEGNELKVSAAEDSSNSATPTESIAPSVDETEESVETEQESPESVKEINDKQEEMEDNKKVTEFVPGPYSDRSSQSPERLLDSSTDSVPPSESSMESSQTYTSSLESSCHSPPLEESSLSSEKESSDFSLPVFQQHKPPLEPQILEAPSAPHTPPTRRLLLTSEVAGTSTDKNQPQLMKIRKINSVHMHETADKPKKQVGFKDVKETDSDKEDTNSYVCKIVGGVPQKIPVESKKSPSQSPVQIRPKNPRRPKINRRVSCKDLGKGDCEGWLYKRRSKGGTLLHSPWQHRWCVIKDYNLFCFHDKEAVKAEVVIHLPAFQCSPVDNAEFHTKKHAFKVHNSGTTFYFASDRQEDMSKWMNKMGLAAISFSGAVHKPGHGRNPRSNPVNADFSEDSEGSTVDSREPSPGPSSRSSHGSADRSPYGTMERSASPQVQRSEITVPPPDIRASQEDLVVMMRRQSQRAQNILGEDKNKKRRTAISQDLEKAVTPEKLAWKKKNALERTLRAKEKELEELEQVLLSKMSGKIRTQRCDSEI